MTGQQQTPAGWYPDPSGAGGQKYWDGQRWIDSAASAGSTAKLSSKTVLIVVGVLAVVLLGGLVAAWPSGEPSRPSSSPSTSAPVLVPQRTPTTATPIAECAAADPDLVAQIEGQLGGDHTLADAFQVDSTESGYLYVGGNIMDGETKVSSSDVWIAEDGFVLYALSGTAREMTPLADGRDLGLSAGDDFGLAVQDCTQVAERARNSGGN